MHACGDECETCPVCREDLTQQPTLMMPVCGHKVHTSCALNAAQYDVRCPLCRAQDPNIETKRDRESRVFSQIEEYAAHQEHAVRQYRRRRSRVICAHPSLRKMRDRAQQNQRELTRLDRELSQRWLQAQRRLWSEDATIAEIKTQRRRVQRRLSMSNRALNERLNMHIGEAPDLFML